VLGREDKAKLVYLIDFGLSCKYINRKSKAHIEETIAPRNVAGTPMFVSANTLNGLAPSRRDDIESLFYVVIYLVKGTLPWKGNPKAKTKTSMATLCEGLPSEFVQLGDYIRQIEFEQAPNYSYIHETIGTMASTIQIPNSPRVSHKRGRAHSIDKIGSVTRNMRKHLSV
jgi:serine/threonine protein kinase